ncbi:MAG TPA: 4-oxalocrotonate tautomerase family protein [Desulforhopalus sp.]|jgi:4-oxalocrotonate tautomerase|nr:4-oxalocrotonate tautomerase family protein [Desulforhopalus sp.]
MVVALPSVAASLFPESINQEPTMPYVNIRVAGTLSAEQKEKISSGVTEVIAREANKPPESVLIFIDEVPHGNIAKAGKPLQPPK